MVTGVKADEMKRSCAGLAKKLLGTSMSSPTTNASKQAKQEKPKKQESRPIQQENQPLVQTQAVIPVGNAPAMASPTPLTTMADGTVLYVAMTDESEKLNYDDACLECSRKGQGWRLPTLAELKVLEKNKKTYGNLNTSIYGNNFCNASAITSVFISPYNWFVNMSISIEILCPRCNARAVPPTR